LSAADGTIVGTTAKLATNKKHVQMISSWTDVHDTVQWQIQVKHGGTFHVQLTYSAAPPGGAEYEIFGGDQKLVGKVAATKGAVDFATVTVGDISFAGVGPATVLVQPTAAVGAVMSLQEVKLVREAPSP